jgi:hypothetical protein
MRNALKEINYNIVPLSDEVRKFSEKIIAFGILPPKSINDSIHISAAVISDCDLLATWNMKHLANYNTNNGIRSLSINVEKIRLQILPPSMLIGGLYDTETDNK